MELGPNKLTMHTEMTSINNELLCSGSTYKPSAADIAYHK